MIFDNDNIDFKIITVTQITRKKKTENTVNKKTSAISYRFYGSGWFNESGRIYEYQKNDMVFVPAGSTYTQYSENEEIIFINLDIENYDGNEIEIFTPGSENIGKLFEEICAVWNTKQIGYYYRCKSLLNEMFFRLHSSRRVKNNELHSKIEASVEYMHSNVFDPSLTICRIAERSGISEVYFRQCFSAEYGVSPLRYINDLRINYAKPLLLCGDLSINEIALKSGFASYQHFYECFRRYERMSPSEFAEKR